jgi:hypothetical protein
MANLQLVPPGGTPEDILAAWDPSFSVVQTLAIPAPGFEVYNMSGVVLVSFGTFDLNSAWVQKYVGGSLSLDPPATGRVNGGLLTDIATPYYNVLNPLLTTLFLPTVLIGHGIGGAMAQIVGGLLIAAGVNVQGVYSLGTPGLGNSAWLPMLATLGFRLENALDPVVALPGNPAPSFGGFPPGWNFLGGMTSAVWGGTPTTLGNTGALTSGSSPIMPLTAVQQLVTGTVGSHAALAYLSALMLPGPSSSDLLVGANGYAQPWLLWGRQAPPNTAQPTPLLTATLQQVPIEAEAQMCNQVCGPNSQLSGFITQNP